MIKVIYNNNPSDYEELNIFKDDTEYLKQCLPSVNQISHIEITDEELGLVDYLGYGTNSDRKYTFNKAGNMVTRHIEKVVLYGDIAKSLVATILSNL